MSNKIDYGPCTQCGTVNSHSANTCRNCYSPLSWSKPRSNQPSQVPGNAQPPSDSNADGINVLMGLAMIVGGIIWVIVAVINPSMRSYAALGGVIAWGGLRKMGGGNV